jgi:hypothetical protein
LPWTSVSQRLKWSTPTRLGAVEVTDFYGRDETLAHLSFAGAVYVKLSEDDMARLEAALRPEAVSGPRYNEKLIAWVDR